MPDVPKPLDRQAVLESVTDAHSAADAMLEFGLLSDVEETPEPEETQPAPEPDPSPEETPGETPAEESPPVESPETLAEEAQPEESPEDTAAKYRVKVDGAEVVVTLEELQKGYSRTEDYTRKTQALAEQRKAAEAEVTQLRANRTQYEQQLAALKTAMDRGMGDVKEPEWAALRGQLTPEQFAAAWAPWAQYKSEREKVDRELDRVQQEQADDSARQRVTYLTEQAQKVIEVLPDMKEPEKRAVLLTRIRAAGQEYGYTDEELNGVVDARAVRVLHDAMLYRALQKGKPTAIQDLVKKGVTVKASLKTVTPGPASSTPGRKSAYGRAMERLKSTGRRDDAARAFFALEE